jgi:hypothetical protein
VTARQVGCMEVGLPMRGHEVASTARPRNGQGCEVFR